MNEPDFALPTFPSTLFSEMLAMKNDNQKDAVNSISFQGDTAVPTTSRRRPGGN